MHTVLLPEGWKRPKGYSNGIAAEGRMVFVAGQIGWNGQEEFVSDDFADQCRQALTNTRDILAEAGAEPAHVTRMTWYVTSREAYNGSVAALGPIWRETMGKTYPTMAVVIVAGLIEPRALVEIETTAVIPHV